MVKFLKPGKVVIVLNGRYAGKKAVIVKNYDDGEGQVRPYGHALVAGVERTPLKVTKGMGEKRAAKRARVKPFIKIVNYNHIMPTRYAVEIDAVKTVVNKEVLKDQTQKLKARKELKKLFEDRYKTGKNKWFFQKLRF
eukprot:Colp12_sorted_trinity150504_noHs@20190